MVLSMNGIWVSTHMPLARHDIDDQKKEELSKFLLTCLLRGMTHVAQKNTVFLVFLLTCLLRGMTYCHMAYFPDITGFYSHASCEA